MNCVDMRNLDRAATLNLKGRVDLTCLFGGNQTHFASAVGPKCLIRFIMEKSFM